MSMNSCELVDYVIIICIEVLAGYRPDLKRSGRTITSKEPGDTLLLQSDDIEWYERIRGYAVLRQ